MSAAPAPDANAELLLRTLREGMRAEDSAQLAEALELPPNPDELEMARRLVSRIGQQAMLNVALASVPKTSPAQEDPSRLVPDGRASFLMRLTDGGGEASVDLGRIADLRTLVAVLRAGNLRQRRAATLRIGALLSDARFGNDSTRAATEALDHPRAFATAYEAFSVLVRLTGADGRRARAAGQQWEALAAGCEARLRAFWEDQSEEPITALADDQRVQLLVRTRDLSDELVRHIAALVAGGDGVADRRARAALIGALRYAGDARLLPALRSVLAEGESELFAGAARALGHIDDPRARAALKARYERTAAPEQRLLLAGALGLAGDPRGLSYVREVLAAGDDRLLRYALQALSELGGHDDVQPVTERLAQREPALAMAAVQTWAESAMRAR